MPWTRCSPLRIVPRRFILRIEGQLLVHDPARWLGGAILVIVMVLSNGPLYAEWVEVQSKYQSPVLHTVYYDPETIRREGNLVTLTQLTDYRWMQGGPRSTPRFLSTTTQKQFDCAEKRLRLLAFTEFPRRMASGRPAAEYVDKDKWLSVREDSIDQALWEVACAGK